MSFTEQSEKKLGSPAEPDEAAIGVTSTSVEINASGHPDQLVRQYGLLRVAGAAITIDNAWVVLGSSISVSILNGGIPGIIYGLLVAGFYYTFIGLSLSELASSLPSSGGVYHWATMVAGPRNGRIVGFFTGWINFFAWMFGLASLVQVTANTVVQMYATYHSEFVSEAWSVYIAYLGVLWVSVACVVFANWLVPHTQNLGMFLVFAGGLATIITLAVMPKKHASNHFVWGSFDENNETGWGGGVAFMSGVLSGTFTIGTPDSITHMAEEVKEPRRNLPKGIMLQIILGTLSAFLFAIVLGYSINDISVLQGGVNTFPLAAIYHQATDSAGATFGLLFIIFLSLMCGVIGTVLTATRTYWALARDNAVPVAHIFSRVNETLSCPVEATVFVGLIVTALGAIPIGSSVGFTNLTGSFIILNSISYAIPFTANVMTGRKNFQPGPFYLGKYGYAVNIIAVLCIALFDIFFCFPAARPFDGTTMNYNSVIIVGIVIITAVLWFTHAVRYYKAPQLQVVFVHDT
ncbi:choline transporter [Ophiostoma piceae UAMH 11346]|uniref:Choline transporter n=1 Tax=Ophiostoma piceae (strain UAMH 11346) TaxID=1262450 RepID=S3CRJ3_OPHP1|nr:choline transporter [Ophiostoma piceae UAMH 11346]